MERRPLQRKAAVNLPAVVLPQAVIVRRHAVQADGEVAVAPLPVRTGDEYRVYPFELRAEKPARLLALAAKAQMLRHERDNRQLACQQVGIEIARRMETVERERARRAFVNHYICISQCMEIPF